MEEPSVEMLTTEPRQFSLASPDIEQRIIEEKVFQAVSQESPTLPPQLTSFKVTVDMGDDPNSPLYEIIVNRGDSADELA